jgi:hypothetical protein
VELLTRLYQAGTRRKDQHEIEYLWSQLDQLQDEDWPTGVFPTPRTHDCGTAGFPDGAGLVWKTGDPMPPFPIRGVMFVGNFTDSKEQHDRRRAAGKPSPGEPPIGNTSTWRNLYQWVDQAGIKRQEIFFTNIYVGLSAKKSRGRFPGSYNSSFKAWCVDFLGEQIGLMQPRAVVALGVWSREAFGWPAGPLGVRHCSGIRFNAAALMHPSAEVPLREKRADTGEVEWDYQVRILTDVAASGSPVREGI